MFAILKIKVTGFRMLSDNFTIDFVTKARVDLENDGNSEVFEIDKNLYSYNMLAFTGSNSSGKSTTLSLISKTTQLMKTGRWQFKKNDFNSEYISLYIEFYLDGNIYKYESKILPLDEDESLENISPFCKITNEKILYSKYESRVGKRYASELQYTEDCSSTGIDDTSRLILICKNSLIRYSLPSFTGAINSIISSSFFDLFNLINEKLVFSIIQLLDESIEYIKVLNENTVLFKRFSNDEIVLTKRELLNVLSNGTIKGIELYLRVTLLLKNGGLLIIDEIEDCFHKNLVNNIFFLFMDKNINKKNAQIIFSTHYVEIIDTFERRDNIFILHKNDCKINISNLYEDYDVRSEILKSKQFNNNTFNTLVNYEKLMEVKGLIKNEISNND